MQKNINFSINEQGVAQGHIVYPIPHSSSLVDLQGLRNTLYLFPGLRITKISQRDQNLTICFIGVLQRHLLDNLDLLLQNFQSKDTSVWDPDTRAFKFSPKGLGVKATPSLLEDLKKKIDTHMELPDCGKVELIGDHLHFQMDHLGFHPRTLYRVIEGFFHEHTSSEQVKKAEVYPPWEVMDNPKTVCVRFEPTSFVDFGEVEAKLRNLDLPCELSHLVVREDCVLITYHQLVGEERGLIYKVAHEAIKDATRLKDASGLQKTENAEKEVKEPTLTEEMKTLFLEKCKEKGSEKSTERSQQETLEDIQKQMTELTHNMKFVLETLSQEPWNWGK